MRSIQQDLPNGLTRSFPPSGRCLNPKTEKQVRNESSDATKSSCKQNLGVYILKINLTYRVGEKVA